MRKCGYARVYWDSRGVTVWTTHSSSLVEIHHKIVDVFPNCTVVFENARDSSLVRGSHARFCGLSDRDTEAVEYIVQGLCLEGWEVFQVDVHLGKPYGFHFRFVE